MCNEFVVRWVDGQWAWIHVGKGRRLISAGQGEFDFGAVKEIEHRFHVREDELSPVVIMGEDGAPELCEMRWGFPQPRDETKLVRNVANLRSTYWQPWLEPPHRCLVPVSEFCELDSEYRRHWFKLKDDAPFMFAGIWRPYEGLRGTGRQRVRGRHLVFAFLTTEPNNVVGAVHDRMPVILTADKWMDWLTLPFHKAKKLIMPPLDDAMAQR